MNEGDNERLAQAQLHKRVFDVIRRLGDVSSQTEAIILEARQLVAWKAQKKPRITDELTDEDRKRLATLKKARISEAFTRACAPLLKSLTNHKWAFPFQTPVDTVQYFDYLKVVETPMDLSTIKSRLDSGHYKSPKDFILDVKLVFDNAMKYNPEGSDCHLMAKELKDLAETRYAKNVVPRLQEDERLTTIDEQVVRKKRALTMDAADSHAVSRQVAKILRVVSDLQAAALDTKSEAASLCQVMTKEEKKALVSALQSLSSAQMEAVMAFVATQQPMASIKHIPPPPPPPPPPPRDGAGEPSSSAAGVPVPKVTLVLSHYDSVVLRQLQHYVQTLSSSSSSQLLANHAAPTAAPPAPPDAYQMDVDAPSISNDPLLSHPKEEHHPSTSTPSDPMDIVTEAKDSEPEAGPSNISLVPPPLVPPPPPNLKPPPPPPPSLFSKTGVIWPGLLLGSGVPMRPRSRIDTGSNMEVDPPAMDPPAPPLVKSGPRASSGMKRKAPAPIMVPSGEVAATSLPGGPPSSGRKQQKHHHHHHHHQSKYLTSPIPSPLEASVLMPPPPPPLPLNAGLATPGSSGGLKPTSSNLMPPPANRPPSTACTPATDKAKAKAAGGRGAASASPRSNGPTPSASSKPRPPPKSGNNSSTPKEPAPNPKETDPVPVPATASASTSAPSTGKAEEEPDGLNKSALKPPPPSSASASEARQMRRATREQGAGKEKEPGTTAGASGGKPPLPSPVNSPAAAGGASTTATATTTAAGSKEPAPAPVKKNVSTAGFSKSAPLSSPRPVPSVSVNKPSTSSAKDPAAKKDKSAPDTGPKKASEAVSQKKGSSAPKPSPKNPPLAPPPPPNGSSKPSSHHQVNPTAVLASVRLAAALHSARNAPTPLAAPSAPQSTQQRQAAMVLDHFLQASLLAAAAAKTQQQQQSLAQSAVGGSGSHVLNGPINPSPGVLDLSKPANVPAASQGQLQGHLPVSNPQANGGAPTNAGVPLTQAAREHYVLQLLQQHMVNQQLRQRNSGGSSEPPSTDAAKVAGSNAADDKT